MFKEIQRATRRSSTLVEDFVGAGAIVTMLILALNLPVLL